MRRSFLLLFLLSLVVGCASDEPAATTATSTDLSSSSTTTAASSTTATTTTVAATYEVLVTEEVEYMVPPFARRAAVMDVYAPESAGPWPVVIVYHADPNHNTKFRMRRLALALAEQGNVVFNTDWGASGRPGSDAWEIAYLGQGPCTYWFAHQQAQEYGGDPNDISLVGFSGGANMAVATAMYGGEDDLGCAAPPVAVQPSAVIAFEGDWLIGPWWDDVIASDPDFYAKWAVWQHIDHYDGAPIHLLVDRQTSAADPPYYSVVGLGAAVDEFLALRDADGSIAADLSALGALEDNNIDLIEFNLLFNYRLEQAGVPATLTWIDQSPHAVSWAAVAAINDLLEVD